MTSGSEVLLLPLLLGVAGIGAVLALGLRAHRRDQARRAALAALAAARGWSYAEREDGWAAAFTGVPFERGDDRSCRAVLQGEHEGRPLLAFDYSYETSSTDSNGQRTTTTHRYAVCALRLPAPVPALQVTRENVLTRLAGAVTGQDLELESDAFNRRHHVRAQDPRFGYDVLHPRTMQALLERPPLDLRLHGDTALAWAPGVNDPAGLLDRLGTLALVVDGVPAYVWQDLGRSRP